MLGYFFKTSASSLYSDSEYIDPLGLLGELNIISLVFDEIEFSSCLGVILKSTSIEEGITTGYASDKVVIAE